MARHYINSEGKSVKYTPHQQKSRTMRALGLDIENPADNRIYKSLYDDITRRVRQYNIIQNLDKAISPSDALFDVAYGRLKAGITDAPTLRGLRQQVLNSPSSFSPSLENIYSQKLVSNTAKFRERVRANPFNYIEQAIKNEENVFRAFLNTSGVDNDLATYNSWLNDAVYVDTTTGEYISSQDLVKLSKEKKINYDDYELTELTRKDIISDIKEVRDFLNRLANDRRNKYRRIKRDSIGGEDIGNYRYTLA